MGYTSADSDSSNSVLLKEEYRREGQYHDSTEEGSSADEMIRKFGGHNERSVRDCTGAKTDVALLREKGRNKDAIHNVEDEEYGDEEMYEADELEEDEVEEEDEEEEIEESVAEDMAHFVHTFKGIESQYRLINRIGEGTFSTVYKAEDLQYHTFRNDWDDDEKERKKWSSPSRHNRSRGIRGRNNRTNPSSSSSSSHSSHQAPSSQKHRTRFVAIKKIYVTSSPGRIFNELELLYDLRNADSVCPLITAFRHHDQVAAVLPYFAHADFRDYYRDMRVSDMRLYMRSLFRALASVHEAGIIHRDIKPTNFLYRPTAARGVLVDFGLAERQDSDWRPCLCWKPADEREQEMQYLDQQHLENNNNPSVPSFPRDDPRPSKRANRAGTRGFRAPEVLLKCTGQSTALDIWSAGVILLTLLARRFPFFHSADDIDALLEITGIVGKARMRRTARLHGLKFDCSIPSYSENGLRLDKIILWCTGRTGAGGAKEKAAAERDRERERRGEDSGKPQGKEDGKGAKKIRGILSDDEVEAIRFLERCLDCDPQSRITAEEALEHPFLTWPGAGERDTDGIDV